MQKWEYFDKETDKRIMEDMTINNAKNRVTALDMAVISGMFIAIGMIMLLASIETKFTGVFGRIDYILVMSAIQVIGIVLFLIANKKIQDDK